MGQKGSHINRRAAGLAAVLLFILAAPVGQAHEPGMTGIVLDVGHDTVTGEFQLPLKQLGGALGLDLEGNPDRVIPDHGEPLTRYVANHTSVSDNDGQWTVTFGAPTVQSIDGLDHFVLPVTFVPVTEMQTFTLLYEAIVEADDTHEIMVTAGLAGGERVPVAILYRFLTTVDIDPGNLPAHAFGAMVRFGFVHVSEGADHMLFLLVLLLPAPLIASARAWVPSDKAARPFWRLLHVVTAFTIGHSITLMASAFGWVNVPGRPVEILIAVSVAVGAIHAIRPLVRGGEPVIAGTFGLVHGLAFAGLLSGFNLGTGAAVTSLLGFNVGVELAQLAAVALVFPSLWLLSRTRVYPRVRVGGGILALVAATAWGLDRAGALDNPLAGVEGWIVGNPLLVAGGLAVAAAATWYAGNQAANTGAEPQP